MSRFQFREISLENYRCFNALKVTLEGDTTVLFAENGGGKTALLSALALGLAAFQPGVPRAAKLDMQHDPKMRTLDEREQREPVGPCKVAWTADVGEWKSVTWSTTVYPSSSRCKKAHLPIFDALEHVRTPGVRWPLFAWYGVDRLSRSLRKVKIIADRWEAYASSLDPDLDEASLLQWLQNEALGDYVRRKQNESERLFHEAVMETAARATPGVARAWYDPATNAPMVHFDNGQTASWRELSDGYHAYFALVADIARRAVMLNGTEDTQAPERVEGVVLIDEIDLHLHPRWQRVALPRLRNAFPKLQFVVTTHSPQVLSGVENRQARRLIDGTLQEHGVFVEGRDTNAILREFMRTDARDDKGADDLNRLHSAIDRRDRVRAKQIYQELTERWGDEDSALIRAGSFMEDIE